ncbi:MAG: adenosylmethionine decarboxylase [Candidatus Micrarchaeia archaeon]
MAEKTDELTEGLYNAKRDNQGEEEAVIGSHVFGNLYKVDEAIIKDLEFIKNTVIEAAVLGKMHILEMITYKFDNPKSNDNGGVSVIALIEESHISVHTWPESKYVTVDVYSCGPEADSFVAFDFIVKKLNPKYYEEFFADRGNARNAGENSQIEVKRLKIH